MTQQDMGLCHRISTAAFSLKAIGVAVGVRFRDAIQSEQVECLHGPVGHRVNAESAPFDRRSNTKLHKSSQTNRVLTYKTN
jgi:hypothetical protein